MMTLSKRTEAYVTFASRHVDTGLASYTAGLMTAATFMALSLGPGWAGFLLGFIPVSLLTSWTIASNA